MPKTCGRGKANPSSTTKLSLFALSAGHCQNPECLALLFKTEESGETYHFAEIAHIIAASPEGSRGDDSVKSSELGSADNLILLCANCHTLIDKAEKEYPVELLRAWKGSHAQRIDSVFGTGIFSNRPQAMTALECYLTQNALIFERYGPGGEHRFDPESEKAAHWNAKVLETILPNNRAMMRLLDNNQLLMLKRERATTEAFRLHIQDLERRHLGGESVPEAARFTYSPHLLVQRRCENPINAAT